MDEIVTQAKLHAVQQGADPLVCERIATALIVIMNGILESPDDVSGVPTNPLEILFVHVPDVDLSLVNSAFAFVLEMWPGDTDVFPQDVAETLVQAAKVANFGGYLNLVRERDRVPDRVQNRVRDRADDRGIVHRGGRAVRMRETGVTRDERPGPRQRGPQQPGRPRSRRTSGKFERELAECEQKITTLVYNLINGPYRF